MRTLKFTTYWTTQQAEDMYLLLEELKTAIWESYGEDIFKMHQEFAKEQREEEEKRESGEFDDDLPVLNAEHQKMIIGLMLLILNLFCGKYLRVYVGSYTLTNAC